MHLYIIENTKGVEGEKSKGESDIETGFTSEFYTQNIIINIIIITTIF